MNSFDKLLAKCHGQALFIILWSYMIGGAFLYCWIERPTELLGYEDVKKAEGAVMYSVDITVKGVVKYINVRYSNNSQHFQWLTNELVNAEYIRKIRAVFLNTTSSENSLHPQYVEPYKGKPPIDYERWGFISSLLFVVTTLTTIGFGHVFPTTELGRGILIPYCLLAIPLMSLYLLDISITLSKAIEKLYRLYRRLFLRPVAKAINLLRPASPSSRSSTVSTISRNSKSNLSISDDKIFITTPTKVLRHQCAKGKKRNFFHGHKTAEQSNNLESIGKNLDLDDCKRKRQLRPLRHCETSPLLVPASSGRQIVVKANHRKRSCNLKIRKASAADEQKHKKSSRLLVPSKRLINDISQTTKYTPEPVLLIVPNVIPGALSLNYLEDNESSNSRRDSNDTTIGYLLNTEQRLSKTFEPKLNVPFYFILTILLLYLILGTVTFSYADDWTTIECLYSMVITLTTIGFGDIEPGYKEWTTQEGKIINLMLIFYIMGGLSLMAMTVRMMAATVFARCMKVIDCAGSLTKVKHAVNP